MTLAISIAAILTVLALLYSFINQQSLWQSSMDNDVVIERRMNMELSEQSIQIDMVKKELEQNIAQARAVLSQLPSFVIENSPGISRMKDIQTFIH